MSEDLPEGHLSPELQVEVRRNRELLKAYLDKHEIFTSFSPPPASQDEPSVDAVTYGVQEGESDLLLVGPPESATLRELSDADREELARAGVDPAADRFTVVSDQRGQLGVDVAGRFGTVRVRFDNEAMQLEGAAWAPDGSVVHPAEGNIGAHNWKPWVIAVGPGTLAGTRYDDLGQAVRAALRGQEA